ncbi:hypothetical protein rosmuc_03301 [Roseovarius mucosus DSM 17069]|uniref:Uncharacterized protein n=1 Tax=Roseovarius mucosus DSM 17069 TaxID=1288298 RepID=A0A0A0HIN8_9RHOB|nr:hypothetical protein [Roseovarius mucosus]KGM87000.1 hypothetical protein rosmuc_03301 [Roseovarius mucosus DSM 17069]
MTSRVLPVLKSLLKENEKIRASLQDLEEVPSSADRDISAYIRSVEGVMVLDRDEMTDWIYWSASLRKGNDWTARQQLLDKVGSVVKREIEMIEDAGENRFLSNPVMSTSLNQTLIIDLHESLAELVNRFSNTNTLTRSGSPLDDLTRTTVIAMLEGAIAMIKSPVVDAGYMKNLKGTIATTSKKVAAKGVENGLSVIMDNVVELIGKIFSNN